MSAQTATAMQQAKTAVPVKQTVTDDVFDRMQKTYDTIARRAFEIFDSNGRWFGHELEDWLRAESEVLHPVHLEITENNENLAVRAEVPGFAAKELTIDVEPTPANNYRQARSAGREQEGQDGLFRAVRQRDYARSRPTRGS